MSNFKVVESTEIKVCDFGRARVFNWVEDKNIETNVNLEENDFAATKWEAPESLANKEYSTKSDIWSFAMTVYEVYYQEEPFKGISVLMILHKIQ